jgi:hypothetical protein
VTKADKTWPSSRTPKIDSALIFVLSLISGLAIGFAYLIYLHGG